MILPLVQTPSTSEMMMRMSSADAMRRMLSDDRGQQRLALLGRVEEVSRILRLQRFRRRLARSDGDRGRGVRHTAADVIDRIADDDHVAAFESMAVPA